MPIPAQIELSPEEHANSQQDRKRMHRAEKMSQGRTSQLAEKLQERGFVTGHDFSRAEQVLYFLSVPRADHIAWK
jgi:hypothetical protein